MAVKPAPFDYASPSTVGAAVTCLAGTPGARALAGGQSLVPLLAQRAVRPTLLVDLGGLGLDHVEPGPGDEVRLGALVRHRALERHAAVRRAAPLLAEASGWVGHPSVRNRGTLGGSLAFADPAAELPAAVAALGGSVLVEGPGGHRRLTVGELVAGPFATRLAPGEVLVEVRVPAAAARPGVRQGAAFCEWAPRHNDRATAGVGLALDLAADGGIVALGAAACGAALPGPTVLGDALAPVAGGERGVTDPLLRAVASTATAVIARTGDDDTAQLAGLLAARALRLAYGRAAGAAGEAAAGDAAAGPAGEAGA